MPEPLFAATTLAREVPAIWGPIDPALVAEVLGLTPAQSQVAVLLAQGRSSRDIARLTGRGEGTIRWHGSVAEKGEMTC